MATLTIRKADGTQGGALDVSDAVFACAPNLHCVRTVVHQYLANQRAGTHSTKTRGMVRGGGRKPYRQKGTGRARQGSIRANQWRGGAIVFGPNPRSYSYRVNRKVRRNAFCSIWSELAREERLIIIDTFGIEKPKTKQVIDILTALGVDGTALLITEKTDEPMALSARNLPGITPLNSENINAYDLLTHEWVVITSDAIKRVEASYQ